MGANGASGQELQIAPKNRFRANVLRKLWTYHFPAYFHPFFIKQLKIRSGYDLLMWPVNRTDPP
jgi:hypothetical protein